MKMTHILRAAFMLATLCLVTTRIAVCDDKTQGRVVKLSNGVTLLSLLGQKSNGMAMMAHRENFNAHGFDLFSLYLKGSAHSGDASDWHAVTFFDGEKEKWVLTTGGGADCLLHDFRLISGANGKYLRLVVADRDMGESYVDENRVTFSFYELRHNVEGEIGRPFYYFERTKVSQSRQKYCDVGDALKTDLGLENYRDRSH